jgi:hypothetical protein
VLLLLEQVGQVAAAAAAAAEHGPGGLEVEAGEVVANSAAVEGVAAVAAAGNVGVHVAEAVSNPE